MRVLSLLTFSLIFCVASYTTHISAQILPSNGGAGGVPQLEEKASYSLLPARPNEGDTVEIEAQMYGTPVKNAIFSWYIDGALYKKEQGLNTISVYIRKNTKVNLIIDTVAGTKITKEWVFAPQKMLLFWESNTYTPPFYKGKALFSAESELTFHGLNLDVKNPLTNNYANYSWKIDGVVQGANSGVGRNTFTYQADILQYEPLFELLYSNVTTYDQTKSGKSTAPISTRSILRVQTLDSEVFTYEKTPLLGVLFNKKIDTNFVVTKPEVTLVSYPVYFSVASALIPDYTWLLNDAVLKRDSNVLSFKKTVDDSQSRLTLSASNPTSLLQSKSVSYIIDTTTKAANSLFGGFGNK